MTNFNAIADICGAVRYFMQGTANIWQSLFGSFFFLLGIWLFLSVRNNREQKHVAEIVGSIFFIAVGFALLNDLFFKFLEKGMRSGKDANSLLVLLTFLISILVPSVVLVFKRFQDLIDKLGLSQKNNNDAMKKLEDKDNELCSGLEKLESFRETSERHIHAYLFFTGREQGLQYYRALLKRLELKTDSTLKKDTDINNLKTVVKYVIELFQGLDIQEIDAVIWLTNELNKNDYSRNNIKEKEKSNGELIKKYLDALIEVKKNTSEEINFKKRISELIRLTSS